jgi:hypothetical protein
VGKAKTAAKELSGGCSLGERVRWRAGGKWREGTLRDWKGGKVEAVRLDWRERR